MTERWLFFILALLFLNLPAEVSAQEKAVVPDSLVALKNSISLYRDRIQYNSFIYEGLEYVGYSDNVIGHPFFESPRWKKGNLYYKGRYYPQVDMLYDIVSDELVIMNYKGATMIKLLKSDISSFSQENHNFIKIDAQEAKNSSLSKGFYDLLYNGDSQVLAKRKKEITQPIAEMRVSSEFVQRDTYYIKKGNTYYQVTNKSSVLRVLKDHKRDVRRSLKADGINFRKNPEQAIVKMVEYYDRANSRQ
jgi:hypothetical protein